MINTIFNEKEKAMKEGLFLQRGKTQMHQLVKIRSGEHQGNYKLPLLL
jgi:hypothetical protein